MRLLRLAAIAAVTVLAVPATATAAKLRAVIQASQVTTWDQPRQYNGIGCYWVEGHGRESVRFSGSGIVYGAGGATAATWTYGGPGGIPLRAANTRTNVSYTEGEPPSASNQCTAPASPRRREDVRCGTRRATVQGVLAFRDSLMSVGVVDRRQALDFPRCPVNLPHYVPAAGLAEVAQRVRNVLDVRYQKQTMEVRHTFRGNWGGHSGGGTATTVVRWKLTLYRFGAHR